MHRIFVRRTRNLTPHVLRQIASVVRMDPEAVRRILALDAFALVPEKLPARVMVRTAADLAVGDTFTVGTTPYRVAWLAAPDADGLRTARLKLVRETDLALDDRFN